MSLKMSPKNTIKNINSLRFLLILMIMVSHSTLPMCKGLPEYLGECAVAIFFVISGFVLSLSYGERLEKGEVSNKSFFQTRIFKLMPVNLLIIAILIPLDFRLGHTSPWYQILAHSLLIQSWIPTHHFQAVLNGITWFLSDILFFYLIFKYLYIWIIKHKLIHSIPFISIYAIGYVLLTLSVKGKYDDSFIYFFPPFRLIDFMIGIFIYRIYQSESGKQTRKYIYSSLSFFLASVIDSIIIALLVSMYFVSIDTNPNFRCAALYWLPSAIVVFYISSSDNGKGWLTLLLHNKLLLWLGSISFDIYIWHELSIRIIQSIFLKIYDGHITDLEFQFSVTLLLTIIIAWLSNKYFTQPIYHKLIKHL